MGCWVRVMCVVRFVCMWEFGVLSLSFFVRLSVRRVWLVVLGWNVLLSSFYVMLLLLGLVLVENFVNVVN